MARSKAQLEKAPISVHLLLTDECNLDCAGCFYESDGDSTIPLERILGLFEEWSGKVDSVAIGGGEPLLHPHIDRVVSAAKTHGLYVAVTTNGTIRKPIGPDRLHVSCDSNHETTRKDVERAFDYYRNRADTVGINHIVRSLDEALSLKSLDVDTITFLLEKPETCFDEWNELYQKAKNFDQEVWFDACHAGRLPQVRCRQGTASMSLDANLNASPCSNLGSEIPYTGLEETWRRVRQISTPCQRR